MGAFSKNIGLARSADNYGGRYVLKVANQPFDYMQHSENANLLIMHSWKYNRCRKVIYIRWPV